MLQIFRHVYMFFSTYFSLNTLFLSLFPQEVEVKEFCLWFHASVENRHTKAYQVSRSRNLNANFNCCNFRWLKLNQHILNDF